MAIAETVGDAHITALAAQSSNSKVLMKLSSAICLEGMLWYVSWKV
jgi:hypothetical protein